MRTTILCLAVLLASLSVEAPAQRLQQRLGRGVVVAKNGSSATVTWRRLAQEPENATYNVYVDGTRINTAPLANTNFKTTAAQVPAGSNVTVTVVAGGREGEQSVPYAVRSHDLRNMFVDIRFTDSPLTAANYTTKYVWPVDLDGDGEMDYVVDRISTSTSLDCYVEGYLRTGEHLWTVKLGPNEFATEQVNAYDIDCDGKGELILQTSDGTQFWDPDSKTFGLYVNGSATGDTDGDGITDYETQGARNPPRYMTVVDGMTGREKCSVEQTYNTHYNRTNRASLKGEEYNKHVGRVGIYCFDGVHPAIVFEWHTRGTNGDHYYYNNAYAFDFSSGKASNWHELFCKPVGGAAFHQIRIGDVDGDGRDEMIEGGYTMAADGSTLFNAGIAHGDRFRTSDIDPERPGLETFAIQQNAGDMLGQILYDAATGEPIKKWYLSGVGDVGRGECIDIDPDHLGWEMWSTMGGVYDARGSLIPNLTAPYPTEGVWWDGELDREIVETTDSHYSVYIKDYYKGRLLEIAKLSGWRYLTVYAKRAAFWGDIIGDWREELILLHKENGVCVGITGFTTDYETAVDNIYCLLEDPHYRGDCTTKGYYQSPNPGFYLGYGMPRPQLPPCMVADLVYAPNATAWSVGGSGFTDYDHATAATYADGKSVLFDLTSAPSADLQGSLNPGAVYAMPVRGQTITVGGSGSLEGTMDLWKSQQGRLVVNAPMNYTGTTYISEGTLEANTTVRGNVELRARGTLAGNATVEGRLRIEGALNHEGGRLMPGSGESGIGTITLKKALTVGARLFIESDISEANATADLVHIDGSLTVSDGGSIVFTIVPDVKKPAPGRYKLVEYTGTFSGSTDDISVRGLQGLSYQITNEEKALWLNIHEQRAAAHNVRWTGAESNVWNYQAENFKLNGEATEFVAGDHVVVDDEAVQTAIQIDELVPVGNIEFANDTKPFTISGTGGLSGTGDLIKNGEGKVTLSAANSDYTGRTIINSGTVAVTELADGGTASSIGAASASADNLQIGKATLIVNNANTATNRGITLNDSATIQIPSGATSLKGIVKGNGTLIKTGAGQLNITYAGNNTWKSTVLQAGTLAMGTWNTTFGNATSSIHVAGNAAISIFNNNSTSAIPTLNNAIGIAEGKTLTVSAGQRCKVQGALSGKGTLRISFPYVRGDYSTNASAFEGTLNPTSGQFRLTSTLNMRKGTLQPESGVYVVHVVSQKGTEENRTSSIGALQSTATDCTLSTGTWNVGYLGTSTTYAGILNASATLNKYGAGTLSLTGASSAGINVHEGAVSLDNTSAATTTGLVTIDGGAAAYGTGQCASITVSKGGLVAVGKETARTTGRLTLTGTLTVKEGGILRVRSRGTSSACDNFAVAGKVALNSPVFRMERITDDWQPDTDYRVFTGSAAIALSGTPVFEPAVPAPGYLWDISSLESDGIIRVVADPTGIGTAGADPEKPRIHDLSGRKLPAPATPGVYIVNGKKVRL